MKNETEKKLIRLIFIGITLVIIVIGFGFSYLIADLNDAPGVILIGTTITLTATAAIYALGEIVISQKRNTALLIEINNNLKK